MPERAESETRADVARRLDRGPISYEIGSADDPDRPESEPDA
jgi:GTP-binding protein